MSAVVTAVAQATSTQDLEIRRLGCIDYQQCYDDMRRHTAARSASSKDELWLVEHPPVYTLGQAGKPEHLLRATDIPVIHIDRGGQITYHGPGQLVAYLLLDLRRRDLTVSGLVRRIEQAAIDLLGSFHIAGARRPGAPGVYVDDAKIAALGLRIRNGRCYHGIALNVDMDLAPFDNINPCGYEGLRVTQLADLGVRAGIGEVGDRFAHCIDARLASARIDTLEAPPASMQR